VRERERACGGLVFFAYNFSASPVWHQEAVPAHLRNARLAAQG